MKTIFKTFILCAFFFPNLNGKEFSFNFYTDTNSAFPDRLARALADKIIINNAYLKFTDKESKSLYECWNSFRKGHPISLNISKSSITRKTEALFNVSFDTDHLEFNKPIRFSALTCKLL